MVQGLRPDLRQLPHRVLHVLKDFSTLELSTETIRELTGEELERVAGGKPPIPGDTQSLVCPSGATWFMACDTYTGGGCA